MMGICLHSWYGMWLRKSIIAGKKSKDKIPWLQIHEVWLIVIDAVKSWLKKRVN